MDQYQLLGMSHVMKFYKSTFGQLTDNTTFQAHLTFPVIFHTEGGYNFL